MGWNRKAAIKSQRAKTRDGRYVLNLRESELNGIPVLTGIICHTKQPWKKGQVLVGENAYWESGGLGTHGGDDLVDYK